MKGTTNANANISSIDSIVTTTFTTIITITTNNNSSSNRTIASTGRILSTLSTKITVITS